MGTIVNKVFIIVNSTSNCTIHGGAQRYINCKFGHVKLMGTMLDMFRKMKCCNLYAIESEVFDGEEIKPRHDAWHRAYSYYSWYNHLNLFLHTFYCKIWLLLDMHIRTLDWLQIILVSLVNFILQGKEIEDISSQESKLKVKWTTFLQTYTWPRRRVRVSTHPIRDHGLHKDVKRLNAHKFVFSGFSLWWEKHVGCIKFNQCKTQLPTN